MQVLWASNYTVNSSYAYEARRIVPRLFDSGHRVVVVDIRGGGGGSVTQVGPVTILPLSLDPVGNDILPNHYKNSRSDMLITLCDVWAFQPDVMKQTNWFPWCPIDHLPVPPAVEHALKAAKGVFAMTKFGQDQLKRIGVESMYWPLSVDPAIWTRRLTKAEARQRLNVPEDCFLVSFVGVNDSNPSRKGIPELLAAWAMFIKQHPTARLYLHTTLLGNMPMAGARNGVDISAIVRQYGIDPATIIMPDQYKMATGIPASELALWAQASDVLGLPSRGEGFGLPLIEFQRAGCPVFTTEFGGGAELCASGWFVDYEMEWSWQSATVGRPGIASIVENLQRAFDERDNPENGKRAVAFARDFDVDLVFAKYGAVYLNQIAENLILSARTAETGV